jgi:hypothetical protein
VPALVDLDLVSPFNGAERFAIAVTVGEAGKMYEAPRVVL